MENDAILISLTPVVGLALEVIAGKWGAGEERKTNLEKAGYNYELIQAAVNDLLKIIERYS